jgi:DNA-nicking Smr family endonuclease
VLDRLRKAAPAARAVGTQTAPARAALPARDVDDGRELFRRSLAGVQPLRRTDRAEIEPVRPQPLPRPRTALEEEIAPVRRTNPDPLRAAYEDVIPLRDSGRVHLDPPPRRVAQVASPAERDLATGLDLAALLPPGADPDDAATLFEIMMRGTRPIDTRNRVELERPVPLPAPIKRVEDERAALSESLGAPLSFEDRLEMGDEAAFLRPGLPRRVLGDLRRGRWILQGQIDLHGLTRDEARIVLGQFLQSSLLQGKRCVRVIHGKGLGSPGRISILKQLSRGWLAQREEVLAFCQAGPHDGGAGALLVLLRAQNAPSD